MLRALVTAGFLWSSRPTDSESLIWETTGR